MTPELLSRRVLGRGDLRRGAAVPRRGPLGAARRAARGHAEPLPADAAARPQHRRLHAVPDEVTDALRRRGGRRPGIDIFRIFDALNDVEQMRPAIEAVARDRDGGRRGGALLHRRPRRPGRDSSTPSTTTCELAEQIVDAGAHVLAIKDMAGLLRPPAARKLVTALRERFDLPVHLHTHDTAGGQLATLLAAIDAGVDAVDVASAPHGRHHQPAAAVALWSPRSTHTAARHRARPASGDGPGALLGGGAPASTRRSSRGCRRRPAGSTTTRSPAASCPTCASRRSRSGSGEQFEADRGDVRRGRPDPRPAGQGHPVVARSSATWRCTWSAVGRRPGRVRRATRGGSTSRTRVIGFLAGELGDPPGGWPEPFRTKALAGPQPRRRAAELTADDDGGARGPNGARHAQPAAVPRARPRSSRAAAEQYGDVSVLPTRRTTSTGCGRGEEHAVELEHGRARC